MCKIVKNKRLGRVWEFSKTLENGKLSKKRGWPSVHPVTLELGNGLFMMGKPDKVKTKLHLMKEEHLRFWSDSFCGTGNLHLSYYAHTLNLSQVCFSLLQHAFDVYHCLYRVEAASHNDNTARRFPVFQICNWNR